MKCGQDEQIYRHLSLTCLIKTSWNRGVSRNSKVCVRFLGEDLFWVLDKVNSPGRVLHEDALSFQLHKQLPTCSHRKHNMSGPCVCSGNYESSITRQMTFWLPLSLHYTMWWRTHTLIHSFPCEDSFSIETWPVISLDPHHTSSQTGRLLSPPSVRAL